MNPRPTADTLESLRVTLQKLEQTADPAYDSPHLASLKSVLLNRIADLEIAEASGPINAETAMASSRAGLIPLQMVAEQDRHLEAATTRAQNEQD